MHLTPQRRTRIIHAQLLHHQGHSLRQIAEHFNVSHSTVHDDLRLFDTQYPEIAQSLAHAMAVNHAISINTFLEQLIEQGPLSPFADIYGQNAAGEQVPVAQTINLGNVPGLHKQYIAAAVALFRERRLAFRDLQHVAAQPAQPSQPPAEQPTDTTADTLPDPPELPASPDYAGQNLTPPTTSDHPPSPLPPSWGETQSGAPHRNPPPTQGPHRNPPPTQGEVSQRDGGGPPPQNRAQRRQAQREAQRQARKRRQPAVP